MSQADLHTHTTASDGLHRPADNVRMAKEAGLGGIAITDHDTVAGIEEALREGEKLGIAVVPGVEISTAYEGTEIHVLGYYMNVEDPVFLARLADQRKVRDARNEGILARLGELGIQVSMEELREIAGRSESPEETIGRPHIADALVRRGVVGTIQEAFDRYLAKGRAAYVDPPPRITPMEAYRWIKDAGGAAIVAHPGLYRREELASDLLDGGADGVEAHHSDHTPEQEERYRQLAIARGKIVTGGSDFHGARKGGVYHGPIGNRTVEMSVLEQLRSAARR
ncbi:PHP domain-containing protein [Cohnella thailandensis]|uniref:PHP domain-containing protein n=1 Tax=Cohnella thailandensis TaxID=557557 RepID=A0A841T5N6_9BACL|nr:PHP domain-containing protein [Cohnella thailandensis]MBB6636451.1 PHP domain-containing protein [Cohnella thailandensis]MBP1973578.1 putative metal-dependent phosphoesterase TrpH [Cohnella thailandensis]